MVACPVLAAPGRGRCVPGKDAQHRGVRGQEEAAATAGVPPEFKAEIVELCQRSDRTLHQVVKDSALLGGGPLDRAGLD